MDFLSICLFQEKQTLFPHSLSHPLCVLVYVGKTPKDFRGKFFRLRKRKSLKRNANGPVVKILMIISLTSWIDGQINLHNEFDPHIAPLTPHNIGAHFSLRKYILTFKITSDWVLKIVVESQRIHYTRRERKKLTREEKIFFVYNKNRVRERKLIKNILYEPKWSIKCRHQIKTTSFPSSAWAWVLNSTSFMN